MVLTTHGVVGICNNPVISAMCADDNRNQRQLLHDFANCTRKEYLRLSEVVQHQYIMEPHLEAFLRIEVYILTFMCSNYNWGEPE